MASFEFTKMPAKDTRKKIDFFFLASMIFFVWGIINTVLGVTRYGVEQGVYFWFCNVGLFVISYGLYKKDASWLIGYLGIALITQSFWLADSIWRILTKRNLFGLVEFMYQPGYPLDEFIVSHYHFFMIPAAIFAILFLKQRKRNIVKLISTVSILIFAASYFLFPGEQNINCIRNACVQIFGNLNGPAYSITFSLSIILIGASLALLIEKLHERANLNKKKRKYVMYIFVVFLIVMLGLFIVDLNYKKTLPAFNCLGPYEKAGIKISCNYTSEFKEQQMLLVYTVENELSEPKLCTSRIIINGTEAIMHKNFYLEPHRKTNIGYVIQYPKENVLASLSISC